MTEVLVPHPDPIQTGVWKYLEDVNQPAVYGCAKQVYGGALLGGGFGDQAGASAACNEEAPLPQISCEGANQYVPVAFVDGALYDFYINDLLIGRFDGSRTSLIAQSAFDAVDITLTTELGGAGIPSNTFVRFINQAVVDQRVRIVGVTEDVIPHPTVLFPTWLHDTATRTAQFCLKAAF